MTEPWQWNAHRSSALTRSGEVSCREVAQSTLDRIAEVNPRVHALTRVLGDEALQAADRADAARRSGEALGTLHGATVTTKINTDHVGTPTDDGVARFVARMPSADSPVVARLRAAGAVAVGRSASPALGLSQNTVSDLHGLTLNAFDAGLMAGGSSGGAAVAVATGMCAIAQGNDLGGSLRWPAFCNGVLGLRPTTGLVPYYNATYRGGMVFCEQLMTVHGLMARCVDDLALGLRVMAGPDARDPMTVPVDPWATSPPPHCRVALCTGASGVFGAIDPAVVQAMRRAGRILQAAGYEVEEVEPPLMAETLQCFEDIAFPEIAESLMPLLPRFPDAAMNATIRYMAELGSSMTLSRYMAALRQRDHLVREWQRFMQGHPVVLLPPCTRVAIPVSPEASPDAVARDTYGKLASLRLAPLLGFPALAMPVHAGDDSPRTARPLGVDILAGRWQEPLCLQVARAIECHEGERPVVTPTRGLPG